jgi:hypothetical protein
MSDRKKTKVSALALLASLYGIDALAQTMLPTIINQSISKATLGRVFQ